MVRAPGPTLLGCAAAERLSNECPLATMQLRLQRGHPQPEQTQPILPAKKPGRRISPCNPATQQTAVRSYKNSSTPRAAAGCSSGACLQLSAVDPGILFLFFPNTQEGSTCALPTRSGGDWRRRACLMIVASSAAVQAARLMAGSRCRRHRPIHCWSVRP